MECTDNCAFFTIFIFHSSKDISYGVPGLSFILTLQQNGLKERKKSIKNLTNWNKVKEGIQR